MNTTLQTFYTDVAQAARILQKDNLQDIIAAAQSQSAAPRLRLLVIGATGTGRASLVNVLLEQPNLLPVSPIPKSTVGIKVSWGEPSLEVASRAGTRTAYPYEKLKSLVVGQGLDSKIYQGVELFVRAEPLKLLELQVETISSERTPDQWKELFAGTDYAILVLKATALLSEREKAFIRDLFTPYLGLERTAIVVSQMDLISQEEHATILEQVRAFLGSFESQPALLEFSAHRPENNLPLRELLENDLIEKHATMKTKALIQTAELCLSEIETEAQKEKTLAAIGKTELEEMLKKLDSQSEGLQKRIERAKTRAENFITGPIKADFLQEIESFCQILNQELPNELEPITDLNQIKKHLPGYLESLWVEFFSNLIAPLRIKLIEEIKIIERTVETDLRSMLNEKSGDLLGFFDGVDLTPAYLRSFLMPRRGENNADTVATGLQLGGLTILILGSLPLGLAAIGVGQLIRSAFKKDMLKTDKAALVASALEATQDLERQIKRQVDKQFEALSQELQQAIGEMYSQGIERQRSAIEEAKTRQGKIESGQEQVTTLIETTLPQLRQALEGLKARLIIE